MSAETATLNTPSLDAMLHALTGEPAAPAPAAAPAETPKEEPKAEAAEAAGEAEGDEAPAAESEKNTSPQFTPEEKNALERARTALRRDGVLVRIIDSLSTEELLKWGGSRAKAQADTDEAYRERAELRKAKESKPGEKPAETTKELATTEPADEPLDLDGLGKALHDAVGDEAVSKKVTGALKGIESRNAKRSTEMTAKLQQLEQATQRLSEAILQTDLRLARDKHGERFPELRDDSNWKLVREKMEKLAPSGSYETIDDLMYEASVLVLGKHGLASSNNNKPRERQKGLPTSPKGSTPTPVKSKDEAAMDFLMELEKKHGLT